MSTFRIELNPPIPVTVDAKDNDINGKGLFGLIRSFEKTESLDILPSVIDCFRSIIGRISRRGILNGDEEHTRLLMASFSTNFARRDGRESRTDGLMSNSVSTDATLIIDAAVRVLRRSIKDIPGMLLFSLSSDLITATSGFVSHASGSTATCIVAEHELVARNAKTILQAIIRALKELLSSLSCHCGMLHAEESADELHLALRSGLRAAASLATTLGTKLARSDSITKELSMISTQALRVSCDTVVDAGASLCAVLPFSGGTDGMTPHALWCRLIDGCLTSIQKVVIAIAPVGKIRKMIDPALPGGFEFVAHWIEHIKASEVEHEKARSFLACIRGLVHVFRKGFSVEALQQGAIGNSDIAILDVSLMLDVVELLLSFPIAAETAYFTTKKRLRSTQIDGGIVSTGSLVELIACEVKVLGHHMLRDGFHLLGASCMLPCSKRLSAMVHAALLTSTSLPLRNALEPTSSPRLDPKRRRWLQASVAGRKEAAHTFRDFIAEFGCELKPLRSHATHGESNIVTTTDKCVEIVCGIVIELQSFDATDHDDHEHWGSENEKDDVLCTCLRSLVCCLVSRGEFLSAGSRRLIDSLLSRLLESVQVPSSKVQSSLTTRAILELGTASISTPWPDGASSSVGQMVAVACGAMLNHGGNTQDVCIAASQAANVCALQSCPRAPAIRIVKRDEKLGEVSDLEAMQQTLASAQATIKRSDKEETISPKKKMKVESTSIPKVTRDKNEARKTVKRSDEIKRPRESRSESLTELPAAPPTQQPQLEGDDDSLHDDHDLPMIVDCEPDVNDL